MRNMAGITVLAVLLSWTTANAQDPLPSPIPTDPTPVPTTTEPLPSPIPDPTTEPAPDPAASPLPSFRDFVREHPRLGHAIRALCDENRDGMLTGRERSAAVRAEIEAYREWVAERRDSLRTRARSERHRGHDRRGDGEHRGAR